jgi:zinc transport system permease protein
MPWPFDRGFMQLALAAGAVVGACAPLVGTFLVHKRLSLLGDGVGHAAFAGVGAGLLLGVWPVWTALVAAVGAAVAVERLRARGRSGDLALALFFYAGLAAGAVLASRAGAGASVNAYLFGSVLTVTPADVATIAAVGAAVVATVATCGRALFAIVLDEEVARVAGLPVDALNALLAAMAAVVVVAAMQVVGVLLVAALMVLPVASAQLVAPSFRATLALSSAIGVGAVVAGLAASRAWAVAPGGSIVLVAAGVFLATSALAGRRGARRGSWWRTGP